MGWDPEYIAYLVDKDFDPSEVDLQYQGGGGPFLFENNRAYVSGDADLEEETEDAPLDLSTLKGIRTTSIQVANPPTEDNDVIRKQDMAGGGLGDIVLNGHKIIFDGATGDTYLQYNADAGRLELWSNGEIFQSWP